MITGSLKTGYLRLTRRRVDEVAETKKVREEKRELKDLLFPFLMDKLKYRVRVVVILDAEFV